MGDQITAGNLLEEVGKGLGISREKFGELFWGTPLDFPVTFTDKLPLGAHRFGMVGITLRGNVWLLHSTRRLSAIELLSLLRHEAEHVRQQRTHPLLFYPLYGLSWLLSFLNPRPGKPLQTLRQKHGRAHAAYRAIPYEVEAYGAGETMRTSLQQITQRY